MTTEHRFAPRRLLLAALVAALAISLPVAGEKAADKAKGVAPPMDEQTRQMMEMMEKMGAPGPQHGELMKHAGKWKAVTRTWMGPGDPIQTEGSMTSKAILGGRFLMDEYKGVFMEKPFEGVGFTGYDNAKKEYFNVWIDNLGTMAMVSRGNADSSGKILTMMAEWEDPSTGQKSPVKMVTTFVDDNTKKFEMFENREGQEVKSMEITYTRAK